LVYLVYCFGTMSEHGWTLCVYLGKIILQEIPTRKVRYATKTIGGFVFDDDFTAAYALNMLFNPSGKWGRRRIRRCKIYIPSKTEIDAVNQFIVRKIMNI
jgi:hypothetical protein